MNVGVGAKRGWGEGGWEGRGKGGGCGEGERYDPRLITDLRSLKSRRRLSGSI